MELDIDSFLINHDNKELTITLKTKGLSEEAITYLNYKVHDITLLTECKSFYFIVDRMGCTVFILPDGIMEIKLIAV